MPTIHELVGHPSIPPGGREGRECVDIPLEIQSGHGFGGGELNSAIPIPVATAGDEQQDTGKDEQLLGPSRGSVHGLRLSGG
jgi:hypothetical protein